MKDWLKKRKRDMRREFSVFLVLVLALTGIPFPVRAGKGQDTASDGWKVDCAWSVLSYDDFWEAETDSMKQPKMVVTYRMDHAPRDYVPGEIQFIIPGIGNLNRSSILKASKLASDEEDSEWSCDWDQEQDLYTFSNQFSVEKGQSLSGGFQLLWTIESRLSESGYVQERKPVFQIQGEEAMELTPLTYRFSSWRDRYRISLEKKKLPAEDYETADQNYIWYEMETRFDKDWLARGLSQSSYSIAVELPEGKDYGSVLIKKDGKQFPLEQIETESGERVWGFYPFQNRKGDLGSEYETFFDCFQIGFLKEHFADGEEAYRTVTVRGHLDRLYQDEEQWITAAGELEQVKDAVSFTVADYSFEYAGYLYNHRKWCPSYENYPYHHGAPEDYSSRMNAVNMYSGKLVQFRLETSANRDYVQKAFREEEDLYRGVQKLQAATPSDLEYSGNSRIDMTLETAENGMEDWKDLHWREHGLDGAALGDSRIWEEAMTYKERHPEKATGSDWILEEEEGLAGAVVALGGMFLKAGQWLMPKQRAAAVSGNEENIKTAEAESKEGEKATPATSSDSMSAAGRPIRPGGNLSGMSQIGQNGNSEDYSLIVGDDKLAVFLTDGTVRCLEDDEYDMVYAVIAKTPKACAYEVYGALAQDTPAEDYLCLGEGTTEEKSTVFLPNGVKAVFVRFNGLQGSFDSLVQLGVRLHLDWKEEQEKAAAGEPVPDHENHLINFSYVRSLYVDQDGYEVNDCAVDTDSYTGTYGRELAKRDRAVYGECTLRAYSNVWLRSPVTNLESKTAMGAFEGNQKNGFTSRVQTGGKIRTDDSAALERFSLYVELPEGLVLNLNPDAVRVKGKGEYLSGEAVSEGDFQNHVSYQVRSYNKKTMLAADFDFSGAPLEGLKGVEAVLDFEVGLSYTDFISFGNQYRTVSYLMVHDDGLDKIAGTSIMTDVYDMDDNGSVLEQAAYSSDREVVLDSATEWREYVSKYVKSDHSAGYGTEAVVRAGDRSAQSGYSYRLDFGLGSNHAKNIDFFDSIEQGARLASHKPGQEEQWIPSQWQGRFLFVDTSYAESMKLIPTVYYSTDEKQELRADADGWRKERPKDPGDVKAVWIHLDTSQLEYGLLQTRQMTYVEIHMEAPEAQDLAGKTAVNQYFVEFDAYGIGSSDTMEARYRLSSAETRVRLLDTIGSIILQKTDGEHKIGVYQDGTARYAPLTGASFQIYNPAGDPMFGKDGIPVNALGQISLSNLPFGTYQWEELISPKGYKKIEGRHSFTVDGITKMISIPNERLRGQVILTKYDRDDINVRPLEGAEFELSDFRGETVHLSEDGSYSEDGTVSAAVTGPDGTLKITNLPWGNYSLTETKAPDGYERMDTPIAFSIGKEQVSEEDGSEENAKITVQLRAYNGQTPASLRLRKVDEKTGQGLKNAVFSLYRKAKEGEKKDVLIQSGLKTDGTGELQADGLLYGTYYFVETKNPMGYELEKTDPETAKTITLDRTTAGQVLELACTNRRMKGKAVLTKTDETGLPVSGAEYMLMYRESEQEGYRRVGSVSSSDENGEIHASELEWGDYYWIETKAPRGFELSSERIGFCVNQETVQSVIYRRAVDQRKKGRIRLIKIDKEEPERTLQGAEYELYKTNGIKCRPGMDYVLPEGVNKIVTGKDGTILLTEIPQGGYYLQETKAPQGYGLSDEKIRFSITRENVDIIQELTAEDQRSRAELRINKRVNTVYEPFGNPTFIFRIEKRDGETNRAVETLYKTITLSNEEPMGSVQISADQGYVYEITELNAGRYRLSRIIPDTEQVSVVGKTARADLTTADYGEVTFVNEMKQYEKLSHTANVENIIKSGVKLTGIRAEYHGPDPIDENTEGYDAEKRQYLIKDTDLTVTAFYDDGTEKILPQGIWILDNPLADGSSDSYTGLVRYRENGTEKTASFTIGIRLPKPWKKYQVVMELNGGTIVRDGDETNTAVERWERLVREGSILPEPENKPKKSGFRFAGWYQDQALQEKYDFSEPVEKDICIYAKWEEAYDVKYAVSIYAINDKDADGTVIPITFGPAGGDLRSSYVNHIPKKGELCIHDLTWKEIIAQVRQDPAVFYTCMKNGCTHSVLILFTDEDGNESPLKGESNSGKMDQGDGVGSMFWSIATSYRRWNYKYSAYFEENSDEYKYGTNKGGWPDSAIRNMLNGTVTDNMGNITNQNHEFAQKRLHESNCLLSCFPEELQNAICPRAIKSDTVHHTGIPENVAVTRDRLWLPAYNEYFADGEKTPYYHRLEGEPLEGQRLRKVNYNTENAYLYDERGGSSYTWFRSIFMGENKGSYALTLSKGGCIGAGTGSSYGIAPCFCIQ